MTAAGFLEHLRQLDVRVRIEDGKVRVSAPRGVLSPALQDEIARRKSEILALVAADRADGYDAPPIVRVRRGSDGPLSFTQQRLWFLDQLEPGSTDYTIAVRSRHRDVFDTGTLREAFTRLVHRHEALRTTFPVVNGQPVQRVHEPEPVELRIIDLADLPASERAAAAESIIQREARRPFDLGNGPLFRPCLLRYAPDDHELLLAIHHIIADGWSLGLLAHELHVLHDAVVSGQPAALPAPHLQYGDYVAWQQQRLSGEYLATLSRYWCDRLAGAPPVLELPTDHPRRARATAAGAARDFVFPDALGAALRRLARDEGATLFMTMLAAFDALLARWTGRADIVVGSPIANRGRTELEGVVGFFANTLVLRTDLSGDHSFRALLRRVRESCLGAYAHQEMPFEKLVEELQPERRMGRNPIFQISFVMQAETTGSGLSYVAVAAPFELTMYVREAADGGLCAAFEYRTDLFEADTIDRMAWQYCRLLEAAVADPDRPVSTLALLSADERETRLAAGSRTAMAYPRDSAVHTLFEQQVDATPDAVALRQNGSSISYAALDARANRLANHLIARGVAAGSTIGICMERSADAIVALLAVLKAGAGFVPLDLFAPPARLGFVLRDAGARLVLTHTATARTLPSNDVDVFDVDADAAAIAARSAERPAVAGSADDVAYVMYTSGTSGEPKGVAVPHRAIVRLVRGTDYVALGADHVILQYAPLSFDASTFEIWGALLNGGVLAIAPPGALSLDELERVLESECVTTLWLTAAIFHQAVRRRIGMFVGLRQLLAGGDVLSPRAVRAFRDAWPDCRLINGYGPTENTTFSCCYTVPAGIATDRPVPIGRPIANSRAYILDEHLEPVPVGMPGELWLAGDGLAVGYHGRAGLTARKFVTHRFSPEREERLYRTGDRARWLTDGTIEFLGRIDDQVKLRGFRIEPAEIEAALVRQPNVREAAVIAHGDGDGTRLIAYVAPRQLDPTLLRDSLRATLPQYMIPSAIETLDRLPTNANGKLDRTTLPEPAILDAPAGVRPRTTTERALVRLWEEVLERRGIGVQDDFFALGGHSLLAVALFARIEQELGVALPLATLFRAPTVEALARLVAAGRRRTGERSLIPIRMDGDGLPLFAVPGVGGNVLCFHELAARLPPDRPFYGLQSRGLDGELPPLGTIQDIASAFIAEIREVQPTGPYHLIGACMGGVVAFEIAHQLRAAGDDVRLLALLESWPPGPSLHNGARAGSRVTPGVALVAERFGAVAVAMARLRGRARLRYLRARIAALGRVLKLRRLPRGARTEYRLRAVVRANETAVSCYRPEPADGDAVLILAAERRVDPDADPRLGWRDLVRGNLDVFSVPGADSGLMLRGDAVRVLAERIRECLER